YDGLDRLFDVRTSAGTFSYRYDAAGNRSQVTAPGAGVTKFFYDPSTNLLSSSSGPSAPAPGSLFWNAAGFLSAGFGRTYSYDGLGRRVTMHVPPGVTGAPPSLGGLPARISHYAAVDVVYHYDAGGRLIAETTPDGTKIRDYYYVAGQLVAVDGCT